MNSHWLKQVYQNRILESIPDTEKVKIFKQEPEDDKEELFATLSKTYFDTVFSKRMKANDISEENVDLAELAKNFKKAGIAPGSDLADDYGHLIKKAGLTYKPENVNEFAKLMELGGDQSDKLSLIQTLEHCFTGNSDGYVSEIKKLVGKKEMGEDTKGIGPGELFLAVFSGGEKASVGDLKINEKMYEVKGQGGRIPVKTGLIKDAFISARNGEVQEYRNLIIDMITDKPTGSEEIIKLKSGQYDDIILPFREKLLDSLQAKYEREANVDWIKTGMSDLLKFIGYISIKIYHSMPIKNQTKHFNYLLNVLIEENDVTLDFLNMNLSLRDMMARKGDWRFKFAWPTGSTRGSGIQLNPKK